MKHLLKKAISRTIQNEFVWSILDKTVLKAAQYTDIERGKYEREHRNRAKEGRIFEVIQKVFPDLTVRHGVFAGMKYPAMESVGSSLFPKLLGSYEKELESTLEKICRREYTEIIDIGCAEGYYAVGLAMRIPTALVYAYDTDYDAIRLCKKMAELNGVSDRVITGAFCDAEVLQSIPIREKALIISDCEGYEKELFNKETVKSLQNHDLLIEIHDCIDISISSHIRQVFKDTHEIEVIDSIDDIKKAQTYEYEELAEFDLASKKDFLAEHRASIMEWFFIQPKK